MSIKDAKRDISRLTKKYSVSSIVMLLAEWSYEYGDYLDSIGEDGSKHWKMARVLSRCSDEISKIFW